MVGPRHGSKPYSTASRHASLLPPSLPCCLRLWMVVKHASQAEHECALNRRCCHEGGVRSCGGSERERFEDCDDCGKGEGTIINACV